MKTTKRPNAFALIVTLIMVVLAVTIVLALLSNASLDRISASATSQRTRAEMAAQSGLAAALNALVGAGGPTDFQYITAAGNDQKPVLAPLTVDATTGAATVDASKQRPLYSQGTSAATITLSSTTSPKTTRSPGYVSMTAKINGNDQEVQRYAFYVDEGGSRQNIAVQGGKDRTYARDPNEVPLMTTAAAAVPLSDVQMTAVSTSRPALFTAATLNPLLTVSSAPLTPAADDYNFATASAISNLAPNGKPRVNLTKLKAYLDTTLTSVDQKKGNDRAKLVDRLLNPGEQGVEWGPDPANSKPGGNLSFLTQTGHYNTQQSHQIVANLIDYLDSDLIPTTDDIDNPTYFGVEGKADASGNVVGHPYVNFVGTGLIFNRSSDATHNNVGGLNSTRIVMVLGLVNPWTTQTKDWDAFYIEPEAEIIVNGQASGGTLGPNASDYFQKTFNSANADPSGNPEKLYPVKNIAPNAGYVFPSPMSSTKSYATYMELKGTGSNGLGQPPGMTFTGLSYKINKLRIKFTSSDGTIGYVQVLDHLTDTSPQPAVPSTADMDHSASPSSLIYKFAGSGLAPGATDKADYHLSSDPRLNFLVPGTLQNWTLSKSTESNPAPPNPVTAVAIFTGSDSNNSDFAKANPSVSNHLWYTKTDITSDFYVKSPPADGSDPKLNTSGEMGYIHTGIPWETLRLYVTGDEANGKQRDKEILSYTYSGTFNSVDYGTVPAHVGQGAAAAPVPLVGGPLNLNTNKEPTLQGLFRGATAIADSDATTRAKGGNDDDSKTIADALVGNAGVSLLALPSDFLALPAIKSLTNAQTKDFDREIVARRVANMIGAQSTRFTVYALGEARDKAGVDGSGNPNFKTTSTVTLKAEVELQADSSGKPMPKVLSSVYYLTN